MTMEHAASHFSLTTPDLSAWRSGNTGVEGVWSFDSGRPGRHVMITALVHGNELCGAWALKGLLDAGVRPVQGRLTLAFCNLEAFERFDPTDHDASRFVEEDLNRQWSAERLADPCTIERRRAAALAPFVGSADWLLDLHSMHEPCAPLALTGLSWRNVELALRMKSPRHIVMDAGHQQGVRMRDYSHFGPGAPEGTQTRALLVECGFHGDPSSREIAQDQCVRFLELSGVVDQGSSLPAGWRLPDAATSVVLRVTGSTVARSERFRFVTPYVGLELIPCGGTLIGLDDGMEVRTPHDDCVLVMPSTRHAQAGVTVVRFAQKCVLEPGLSAT